MNQNRRITVLNDNDVLSGRGPISSENEGNRRYRLLVRSKRREYRRNARRSEKQMIAQSIIDQVHWNGGRFLKKVDRSPGDRRVQTFEELSESDAQKKVMQALREERHGTWWEDGGDEGVETNTMPSVQQPNTFSLPPRTLVYLDMPVVMRDQSLMANEEVQLLQQQRSRKRSRDAEDLSLSPLRTEDASVMSLEEASNELFIVLTDADKNYQRFAVEDLRREKEQMTEQERVAILFDIFGDMHQRLERSEPGLRQLIVNMKLEIDRMPYESKQALMEAMTKAPDEFSSRRLQLFLQCENMDSEKAASRLVRYWEERRSIFGDKFCLPMNLDGALRDDRKALEANFIEQLPGLDSFGRQLVWTKLSNDSRSGYDRMSAARVCWYVLELISRNPQAEKGYVCLVDAGDMTLWEFHPEMDVWYIQTLSNALPITIASMHVCNCEDYITGTFMLPIWLGSMDKLFRFRTNVHGDRPVDALSNRYGISSEEVPTTLGGSLTCEPSHSEWGQFLSFG